MNLRFNHVDGMRDVGRAFARLKAFTDALGAAGVTQLEYQAMLLMKTRPGEQITVGDLARQLKLSRSFSSRLADRLVDNEFALRCRRSSETIVQLSARGGEILACLAARHLEEMRAAEQILTCAAAAPNEG
jgi:DNA-binding MarR family transcriptional regulator